MDAPGPAPTHAVCQVRFEEELRVFFPCWRESGLGHGRVPKLIKDHGAVGAAKHLLGKGGLSEGFKKLRHGDRLECTVEFLVLREAFGHLFTPEDRGVARRRLTESGMPRSALPLEPYACPFAEGVV